MKHSRLYWFITVLGIVLLAIFFAIVIWSNANPNINSVLFAIVPYPYINYLMLFLSIGGTVFLTVGLIGVGTQHFTDYKTEFTVVAAILVPGSEYTPDVPAG